MQCKAFHSSLLDCSLPSSSDAGGMSGERTGIPADSAQGFFPGAPALLIPLSFLPPPSKYPSDVTGVSAGLRSREPYPGGWWRRSEAGENSSREGSGA